MRFGASKRITAVSLEKKKEELDFAARLESPEDTLYVGLVGGHGPGLDRRALVAEFPALRPEALVLLQHLHLHREQ